MHALFITRTVPSRGNFTIIIAEREARRIIVLPDSGPCGYIYSVYMTATDVCWAPPGCSKDKKTMRLPGRAWPLQLRLSVEQETSAELAREGLW